MKKTITLMVPGWVVRAYEVLRGPDFEDELAEQITEQARTLVESLVDNDEDEMGTEDGEREEVEEEPKKKSPKSQKNRKDDIFKYLKGFGGPSKITAPPPCDDPPKTIHKRTKEAVLLV